MNFFIDTKNLDRARHIKSVMDINKSNTNKQVAREMLHRPIKEHAQPQWGKGEGNKDGDVR